ncbi:unnamed protein product [Moneuplotes crassus]|uniref:Protein kinase domain-containing protein n=1 Tax=Euplotes crassus TaxID=5936 RepID=A0AAD2D2P1_EUPCR|nr:unnamed protein product [Moneuplotes crassus]
MSTCGDYNLSKTLGAGAQATVRIARRRSTGNFCAAKLLYSEEEQDRSTQGSYKKDENEIRSIEETKEEEKDEESKKENPEIMVLSALNHPNIIRLLDYDLNARYTNRRSQVSRVTMLIFEYATNGSLLDYIALSGRPLPEDIARSYFHDLCEALNYLHSNGVSHRDIKLENILLNKNFELKLADFGFASGVTGNTTRVGTITTAAPEVLMAMPYNGHCADIFSLGVVLFMMVSGHPPFNCANPASDPRYKALYINQSDFFWKTHFKTDVENINRFSDSLQELIVSMLSFRPSHRPSLSEIMNSSWYLAPPSPLLDLPTPEPLLPPSLATDSDYKTHLKELKEGIDRENSRKEEECPDLPFDQEIVDYQIVKRGCREGCRDRKSRLWWLLRGSVRN